MSVSAIASLKAIMDDMASAADAATESEQIAPPAPTRSMQMLLHRRRKRSSLRTRWLILVLSCFTMIGTYYSLDIPAALHQQLQDFMPGGNKFEVHFNLLYSLYSIPNMILPFFGGTIVDRIGSSTSLIAFCCLTLLGQCLVTAGGLARSWAVMLTGRIVYGFGGESLCVASSTLLSQWFEGGNEVALAFGISLAMGRLGSVLNNLVSPVVANGAARGGSSIPAAMGVGVFMNALSVAAALAIRRVDERETRKRQQREVTDLLSASLLTDEDDEEPDVPMSRHDGDEASADGENDDDRGASPVHLSDVKTFGPLFWLLSASCLVVYGCVLPFNNVASGILLERNLFIDAPDDCRLAYPDRCTSGKLQNGTNFSTDEQGRRCPNSDTAPILPTALNITSSSSSSADQSWKQTEYVFDDLTGADVDCSDPFWAKACTEDYCDGQNRATEKAGRVMSIPYLISAVSSPILGCFVDRVGGRAIIASLASVMLIAVHAALAVRRDSPVLPLIGQGVAYSLYAAVIWPSVPLTVDASFTGTAFGVIMSIQNIGLALFPIVIAAIYNSDGHRYLPNVEYFFVSCAVVGTLAGLVLNIFDRRNGNKLNGRANDAPAESEVMREFDISSLVSGTTI